MWAIFIGFCIDLFSGQPDMWSAYNNIYNNFVTEMYLKTVDTSFQLGPWKFYDMFSLNGFETFFWDSMVFNFVPWYYFFNVFMRLILEDYSWNRGYFWLNTVDPNRWINFDWFPHDPFDEAYWTT